jgi:hypothetical protein
MLFVGAGMKGRKGDDYYFKQQNRREKDKERDKKTNAVYRSSAVPGTNSAADVRIMGT